MEGAHYGCVLLKVVSATFLLVCFACLKESTSEARKNFTFFIIRFYGKCGLETRSRPFLIFKEILCKKESEEASMLIWTNFNSFAITYLSGLLQKFDFPIEVVANSLQTQKGLGLVFRPHS